MQKAIAVKPVKKPVISINLRVVPTLILLISVFYISIFSGCSTSPTIDTIRVESANYDDAFDSVMNALRYEQYTLDRVDRRLGVITTVPQDSASIVEPWQNHNSTIGQAAESTLHHERRIIRVEFQPMSRIDGNSGTAENSTAKNVPLPINQVIPSPAPIDPAEVNGLLYIDVICTIERGHMPGRQIQTTDLRRSNFTIDPTLAERGIPNVFWEPIARDPYMEQRIKNRIAKMGGDVIVENYEGVDNNNSSGG